MNTLTFAEAVWAKPILVHAKNKKLIEALLADANGASTKHAFTRFSEVAAVAAKAEAKLNALNLQKGLRPTAAWIELSGRKVNDAYRDTRVGTGLDLVRRTKGWCLRSAYAIPLDKDGGKDQLSINQYQADAITARLLAGIKVTKPFALP
jgi:hypothetical protein